MMPAAAQEETLALSCAAGFPRDRTRRVRVAYLGGCSRRRFSLRSWVRLACLRVL